MIIHQDGYMPFQFRQLRLPDVILIEPRTFVDDRGFFRELYKASEFAANGISETFIQDNYSHSQRGVLRGMHFQTAPRAQGKLVMALHGEIFDVAVDIRPDSATYGQWVSQVLSARNFHMLYVPAGFAHGFCVLSEEADVLYKVTAEYAPELDRGLVWNDPDVDIQWPLTEPILSPKDAQLPQLSQIASTLEFD
jgi:dTDP-4-dehydrorhamnose 3,5-epimerase